MRQVAQDALADLAILPSTSIEVVLVQGDGTVTNKDIELEEALYGAPGPANVPAPAPTFAETEAAKNIQKNYRMYLAEAPAPSSHY